MTNTSRRTLILGGSAVAATTWVAPSVLALDRVAAATPSGFPGGCIIASTNVTVFDPPPPDAGLNALQSDTTAAVWAENDCFVLPTSVVVNRSTVGIFGGNSNEGSTIPAGTSARSYFVSIDRATNGSLAGSLTFDTEILGLIYIGPELTDSSWLEFPTTTYPTFAIGTPFEASDDLVLSTNTVEWDTFMGGAWSDVMRVIVAC